MRSLQNVAEPAQPTFDYVTTVTVTDGPADLDISLLLPEGFAVADGQNADPATWCPKGTTCASDRRTEPTARTRQSDVPNHRTSRPVSTTSVSRYAPV